LGDSGRLPVPLLATKTLTHSLSRGNSNRRRNPASTGKQLSMFFIMIDTISQSAEKERELNSTVHNFFY